MKIAYIITAYKDAKQLSRLIRALDKSADFFIHIDLKVDITPFYSILSDLKNVFFTTNRFFINWGGFGQVRSQQELLKSVVERGILYDRVVCISGTDYPLWSNSDIQSEFASNKLKEYIIGFNITQSTSVAQRRKVVVFHFFRDIRVASTSVKKVFSGASRKIMQLLPIRRRSYTVMDDKRADVYMGSDYWALTYNCARYVYEQMCAQKQLMRYFKFSFVPSEMVVQTIVFNSPFASSAIFYNEKIYNGLGPLTPLHYIEYNGFINTYKMEDYDKLQKSGKMFFRKAESGISDALLDKVDAIREDNTIKV